VYGRQCFRTMCCAVDWWAQIRELGCPYCKRYAGYHSLTTMLFRFDLLRTFVFGMWSCTKKVSSLTKKVGYGLGVHNHWLRGGLWTFWTLGTILLHHRMLDCPVRLYESHKYASIRFALYCCSFIYLTLSEPSRWGTAMALYMVSCSFVKGLIGSYNCSRLASLPMGPRWYSMLRYSPVLLETQSTFCFGFCVLF
jgi:hypothetical protein